GYAALPPWARTPPLPRSSDTRHLHCSHVAVRRGAPPVGGGRAPEVGAPRPRGRRRAARPLRGRGRRRPAAGPGGGDAARREGVPRGREARRRHALAPRGAGRRAGRPRAHPGRAARPPPRRVLTSAPAPDGGSGPAGRATAPTTMPVAHPPT